MNVSVSVPSREGNHKELSLPKGPLVGMYVNVQNRWRLLYPEGLKEQCMAHLQQRKSEREKQEMVMNDQNKINVGLANPHSSTTTTKKRKDDPMSMKRHTIVMPCISQLTSGCQCPQSLTPSLAGRNSSAIQRQGSAVPINPPLASAISLAQHPQHNLILP